MVASKILMASLTHYRPLNCSAAAASASGPSRLVQQAPDLIKWVRKEGGFVHPAMRISQDTFCGLGLTTIERIPKGSDLIALPPHLPLRFESCIGEEAADAEPVIASLAEKVPEELWAMKLGLKLLQERAKIGSFWWPYISNLPETYSVPIFFQGEDIKNLQYAPLLYQVNKRCRFLLDFEHKVKETLKDVSWKDHPFEGLDVDASSLGWAMSAVSSRAFRLHGKTKYPDCSSSYVPMMLPLVDMCNHSFEPNARIVQEQEEKPQEMLLKVIAEREINENDPLLLNYGCLSNDLFLLDYGFIIPSNPHDCIELKYDGALLDAASMAAGVSSPNFSSPAPWQKDILSQLNLDGEAPVLKVTIGGHELVEGRLLAALRVLLASNEEAVKKHDLNTLKSSLVEAPCGIACEMAAFRTVIALCAIALEHFPTKVMEDESLLKSGVSAFSELAIRFRSQKKLLIVDVMKELSRRMKVLSSKDTIDT
ncbi:hypothetical protein SAY87_001947 [Trapa incisa]|uniref:SET domain-containing protein n=1 Tax=Trapa incisa TaxID=236973 RepID=A0AAN7PUC6_9MYRT|nr:hypothetical protein SAY87_001947 [Trapa incisa]